MAKFKEIYPSIPVYMDYDDPYFKVTAGNCITYEEAVILCGKIGIRSSWLSLSGSKYRFRCSPVPLKRGIRKNLSGEGDFPYGKNGWEGARNVILLWLRDCINSKTLYLCG